MDKIKGIAMRNYGIKLVVYLVFFILSGCVSTVPHKNQPQGVAEGDPNGLYAITTHIPGISMFTGSTTALIAVESTEDGFKANSRPGAAGELLGGFPGFYVNLIGDKRVPGGAFLHWSAQIPVKKQITHGIFKTPLADLKTDFYSYDKPIELRLMNSERLFGLMTIAPANAKDFPKIDYLALINRIDTILEAKLFDPVVYEKSETQDFLNKLRETSGKIRDDVEFLMAWIFAMRHLTFSHCYVGCKLDSEYENRFAQMSSTSPLTVGMNKAISIDENGGIITLRIATFEGDSYVEIDKAFADIIERNPDGLIIDLRDNPGGTHKSSRIVAYLIKSALNAGVFFNRHARTKVLANELKDFPEVSLISIPAENELYDLIDKHNAFIGIIEPADTVYNGQVVVLVNKGTASACEPLVAGLQDIKRATIIGEKTAGSMLLLAEFDVGDGWLLSVPTIDYLTSQGIRLDGRGIIPDIETTSEEAPQAARKFLLDILSR
ncbi:MAG: S41 family peptidase [Bacteroidales bacterium]|nr:S41 family peptidase [Bacteroidales bacterium]